MTDTQDIQQEADRHYQSRFGTIEQYLRVRDHAYTLNHYGWAEDMEQRLQELPLCIDIEAIYPGREEMEFSVLIGTGGPADRVLVTTDLQGEVENATYQFQDWFTPWTEARDQDSSVVEAFARIFYYSPVSDQVSL